MRGRPWPWPWSWSWRWPWPATTDDLHLVDTVCTYKQNFAPRKARALPYN